MNEVNWMTFSFKYPLPASHTHQYFPHLSFSAQPIEKPGSFSSLFPSSSLITFCQQIQSTFFSLFYLQDGRFWPVAVYYYFDCCDAGILPASSDLLLWLVSTPSQGPFPGSHPPFLSLPYFPGLLHSFFCFQLLLTC